MSNLDAYSPNSLTAKKYGMVTHGLEGLFTELNIDACMAFNMMVSMVVGSAEAMEMDREEVRAFLSEALDAAYEDAGVGGIDIQEIMDS